MSGNDTLLVIARLNPERRRTLGVMAAAAGLSLHVIHEVEIALRWLERNVPRAVLLDPALSQAERFCGRLRVARATTGLAVVALASEFSDSFTDQYYGWGVDDVVPAQAGAALIDRMTRIADRKSPAVVRMRGRAIVAEADSGRARVMGRVLALAGYDVVRVSSEQGVLSEVIQDDVALVIASAGLTDPLELVRAARTSGCRAPWIVTSPRHDLEVHAAALSGVDGVAVLRALGPVEDLLFISNELIFGRAATVRRTVRSLHGSVVRFRPPGESDDDTGFTYNVSAGGLYVRTLAPPASGSVWLELCPPYVRRRVRLLARVVWRRPFGDDAVATVPAGFGVEIIDGLGQDLDTWVAAADRLASNALRLPSRPSRKQESERLDQRAKGPVGLPIAPYGSPSDLPTVAGPGTGRETNEEKDAVGERVSDEWPFDELPTSPRLTIEDSTSSAAESPVGLQEGAGRSEAADSRAALLVRRWRVPALVATALVGASLAGWQVLRPSQPDASEPAAAKPSAIPEPSIPSAPPAATPADSSAPLAGSTQPEPERPRPAASLQPPTRPAPDVAALGPREGFLWVEFPRQAGVYLNGVYTGRSGDWLKVKCGTWYTRVGRGENVPVWVSEGRSVIVACGAATRESFQAAE